jgi:hypothetical protein
MNGPTATLSTNAVSMTLNNATYRTRFTLTSTTVSNPITIPAGDSLRIVGGSPTMGITNNGRLVFQGTTTYGGTITTGDTTSVIELRSSNVFSSATTTVTDGFTNTGRIELVASDAAYTTSLTITNGTLTNALGAVIRSMPGTGARSLNLQLNNQGIVDIAYPLTLDRVSAAQVNAGSITLSGGNLSITQTGTSPSFTNTGVIDVPAGRTVSVSGGVLDLTAGQFNGPSGTLNTTGVTLSFNITSARTRFTLNTTTVPGTFTIPAGDSLRLVSGTPTMTITNNGRLVFQGTTTFTGSVATGDTTSVIELRSSNLHSSATTTFATGFTNTGRIELNAADASYTTSLNLAAGTLVNAPTGVIRSVAGTGSRLIAAVLDNQGLLDLLYPLTLAEPSAAHLNSGTINANAANLTVTQTGTTPSFTNSGSILLGAGRTLSVTGGTLNLTGGLLNGPSGTLSTSGVTLNFDQTTARTRFTLATTTVPGAFTIPAGDSLRLVGGSPTMDITNSGRLIFQGTTAYNGTLTTGGPSSTVEIRSSNLFSAGNTTFATPFSNTGVIELTSADAAYTTTLTVNGGTLVNTASGIIRTPVGTGTRVLNAQLDNQGVVELPYDLSLSRASAVHVNSGSITLTTGDMTVAQSGTTPSFTNTGTITAASGRTFTVTGGTLDMTSGLFDGPSARLFTTGSTFNFTVPTARTQFTLTTTTVPGTLVIPAGDSLRLVAGSPTMDITNNGRLIFQGTTAYNGALTTGGPSSTVVVRSSNAFSAGNTTFATPFSNTGVIELTSADAAYTTTLTVNGGTLVNTASGVIRTPAGTGTRVLNAQLDNQGLVDVPYNFSLSRASATHVNSGSITLTTGDMTVAQSGTTPSFTNTGTITAASGRSFTVSGGTLDMTSGLFDGPAARLFTTGATFNFTVPTVRSRLTLTTTTVPGTLTVPAGDSLRLVAGSPNMTLNNLGRLVLQGTISLPGTLTSAAGSEIEVLSSNAFSAANVTFANAFTNNGTFRHRVIDASYTGAITFSSGTFVNGVNGTVSFEGISGTRTMTAPAITNDGAWQTILTNTITGPIAQNGTLTVPSGTLTLASLLTLNSGSVTTVDGTLVKNGSCTNLGGAITGLSPTATCP